MGVQGGCTVFALMLTDVTGHKTELWLKLSTTFQSLGDPLCPLCYLMEMNN